MPKDYKNDFPIFRNNHDLIYLDSGSTSQKPDMVINGIKDYLSNSNSNVHRGAYDISEYSESLYKKSKQKVCDFIGANDYKEIIYTYNSNYALNLLSSSIGISKILKKGDKVLLSTVEHNANIIPWIILKEEIGIEIEYIGIDENYNIDIEDFKSKYNDSVKIISMTHVSNVTGQIFNLEQIGKIKKDDTIFIVDASQSIPHIKIDVKKINCDFLFFTGHKIFADTGIGILWGKKERLKELKPSFSGGGAIGKLIGDEFTNSSLPSKFEPGTPNISGAVSLLKALEYIESIGGYKYLEAHENKLSKYFLEQFNKSKSDQIKIIGSSSSSNRIGVFTLIINGIHSDDISEIFANKNIAIRSGKHCSHKFFEKIGLNHSFRVSLSIYNTTQDIDIFFNEINNIKNL